MYKGVGTSATKLYVKARRAKAYDCRRQLNTTAEGSKAFNYKRQTELSI